MIKTLEELINHMKQENANNIFVVGPYIGDYQLTSPEEADAFRLKGIVKQQEEFYRILSQKILTPCDDLIEQIEQLKPLITTLYAQTVNGRLSASSLDVNYLKGNGATFKCSGCHKIYEDVLNSGKICDCGRRIRPMCLLTNEQYDISKIEAFETDLLKATTIFLIGFDFNEIELCKQLEIIAAKKSSGDKQPLLVVVGECDKEAVYETFAPEFIVDEKPEGALDRFISKNLEVNANEQV